MSLQSLISLGFRRLAEEINAVRAEPSAPFAIWAEEAATLANNSSEWAFGNGDNTPVGHGIVIPFAAELIALSLNHEGNTSGTTIVAAVKNSTIQAAPYRVSITGVSGFANFQSPLAFAAGDIINFRTISRVTAGTSGRVCAWLRMTS